MGAKILKIPKIRKYRYMGAKKKKGNGPSLNIFKTIQKLSQNGGKNLQNTENKEISLYGAKKIGPSLNIFVTIQKLSQYRNLRHTVFKV